MIRLYLLVVLICFSSLVLKAQEQSHKNCNSHPIELSLHTKTADLIIQNSKKMADSICVLENRNDLIPIYNLEKNKIVSISINTDTTQVISPFQQMLKKYTKIECYQFHVDSLNKKTDWIDINLKSNDIVIFSLRNISDNKIDLVDNFISNTTTASETIAVLFNTPNSEILVKENNNPSSLLFAKTSTEQVQKTAAQIIFGGISSKGVLDHELGKYPAKSGKITKGEIRFQYTSPEVAGIDSETLHKTIDSVANVGLKFNAFPGCQVLVAKDRKIIYHECFGYHSYNKLLPVLPNDIYDLASVTKITGPLPAIMQLADNGKINMDEKFSLYWKDFKRTDKEDIIFRDVLAHQAQLKPWIAFWKNTVDSSNQFKKRTYSYRQSRKYPVEVAPHMFLNKNYRKKIYKAIKKSELLPEKHYKYSGLSFYLFPKMIENITNNTYDDFIKNEFYKPLGAYTLDFNAYKNFSTDRIIPTEYDNDFRNTLLHGYVDDEGCAMMGGISGNAGLFSTANDLAKLIQMYVQMGEYGGRRYISEKTMRKFTKTQFPENNNRRGLGFDKPLFGNDTLSLQECYPAYGASKESFGHSGFTGTFVWADPKEQLIYIFLSNRVHPSRKSREIYKKNIRTAIHQGIYDAIRVFKEKNSTAN